MKKKKKPPVKAKGSSAALGTGARFEALRRELATQRGVQNPGALAAAIGQRKYGAPRMAKMAARGRKG